MRIIGLDLGVTGAHKAVVMAETGEFLTPVFSVTTCYSELLAMLRRARAGAPVNEPVTVVMEPTGHAWLPVAAFLYQQEHVTVYLVNSQQVADLRRYYQRHAKSDRIDCRVLVKLPLVNPEKLHALQMADAETFALQRGCKQLDWYARQIAALKNQIIALDRLVWLGAWHGTIFSDAFGEAARWCRVHYYQPTVVLENGPEQISARWQEAYPELAEETAWVATLVDQAVEVMAIYGHPSPYVDWAALQQEVLAKQAWLAQMETAQQALRKEEVHPRYRQLHPSRNLETLKGVGEDSAAVFLSFIGNPARFPDGRHLRGWSGMVPQSRQSADYESKGLHISQAGPNIVKKYLYLDANVARQRDPQLAKIYYDQMVQKGKHHKQAVCAVATHLLDRIGAICRDDRPYQLRDVDGTLVTAQQAREIVLERYTVPAEVRKRNNRRVRQQRRDQQAERTRSRRRKRRGKAVPLARG